MTDQVGKNSVTRISEADHGNDEYLLHPESNDLFVRTGRQIIAGCQLGISVELWLNELSSVMKRVHEWSDKYHDRIRTCYCAPSAGSVVFFFAPPSDRFDFDLADSLVELNLEVRRSFNVGMVEMRQVPWAEFDRFVDLEAGKRVYGDHFRPSPTVEA